MENDSKVLFVDDEVLVLNSIRRLFKNEPYESFYAESYDAAVELSTQQTFKVLITDMKMPKKDGMKLLNYFNENFPNTYRIALTSYSQPSQILAALNHGHTHKYFLKPINFDTELKPAIDEYLGIDT